MRVIDSDGSDLGELATPAALALADERGLDLVEVQAEATPPVVRIMDFGRHNYEQARRARLSKREHHHHATPKEIQVRPKIAAGDLETKIRRIRDFLEKGDRVVVVIRFRGREITHIDLGQALLDRIVNAAADLGTPERAPLLEDKNMRILLIPSAKGKPARTGPVPAEAT